jgi:hypothetical protein
VCELDRTCANVAYRYAKGEAIKQTQSGKMIQKRTPYDFAAVTDHAEYLGMMSLLLDPKSSLQKTEIGKLNPAAGCASSPTA